MSQPTDPFVIHTETLALVVAHAIQESLIVNYHRAMAHALPGGTWTDSGDNLLDGNRRTVLFLKRGLS